MHEIAHSRLHGKAPEDKGDYSAMEVEAESIAYAVCSYYGIDTGENSFGYIASWSKDKDVPELKKRLETITRTASALITDIDRELDTQERYAPELETAVPAKERKEEACL